MTRRELIRVAQVWATMNPVQCGYNEQSETNGGRPEYIITDVLIGLGLVPDDESWLAHSDARIAFNVLYRWLYPDRYLTLEEDVCAMDSDWRMGDSSSTTRS